MKTTQILITISLISIFGCIQKREQVNHFTSSNDTIVLLTKKVKGDGIFTWSAREMFFKDTTECYLFTILFPENISNIKVAYQHVDIKPFSYERLKRDTSDGLSAFLKENYPNKIDTSKVPSDKDNYICIMSGIRGNDTIFIVDENNNKDFRDDSVRLYQKIDWKALSKFIQCKYKVYNGNDMIEDSSWVNIGSIFKNEWWFSVSQYIESTFSIDDQTYQIGVKDSQMDFCFDSPVISLIAQNGIKKDTLLVSDLLKKGEYLKLKNAYYRFDDISNDGKYITLIKEKDFESKIGVQVGMLAPDFKCETIEGKPLSLSDYKGKYLLLMNVTACWSEISSYKCYKDITEACKGKAEFLGIDNSPVFLLQNIKDLKLTGKFVIAENNQIIQMAYRPSNCSRTCFLINPEGRIIEKFEIFDWKSNLEKIFRDKT